jgi:hypothetical protein
MIKLRITYTGNTIINHINFYAAGNKNKDGTRLLPIKGEAREFNKTCFHNLIFR